MANTPRRNWTRPELMRAVELYCRTTFGKIHSGNPEIIKLANEIGRSAGAVSFKLANFVALDPTIDRAGMTNFSKADAEIWEEFFDAPAAFLDKVEGLTTEEYSVPDKQPFGPGMREGQDIIRPTKVRRNQDFFRRMILASYDGACALTGIDRPELLIASHIVGWSEDEDSRLDPRNGILLNALHDRAFDKHLITFEDDYSLVVSPKLKLSDINRSFFDGQRFHPPRRFRPDPKFLSLHRDEFARKAA